MKNKMLNTRVNLLLVQVGVILFVAFIPAVVAAMWHPNRPEWTRQGDDIRTISWDRVNYQFADVIWIDARKGEDYNRGHIAGAFSLDETKWEVSLLDVLKVWKPGAVFIVYCDGAACGASRSVARRLKRELGVSEVYVLKGGWRV